MTKQKPSPSHLERVRQRNQSLQHLKEKLQRHRTRGLGPLEPIGQPVETTGTGNHVRAASSLNSEYFRRAEAALQAASAPMPNTVQVPEERYMPRRFVPLFGRKEKTVPPKPQNNGEWDKWFPRADGWQHILPRFQITHLECCGAKEIHGITQTHSFYREKEERDRYGERIRETKWLPVSPGEFVRFVQTAIDEDWGTRNRPFIIFTDVIVPVKPGKKQRGEALRDFIIENDLGPVVETGRAVNGNSGSILQAFIWTIPDKDTVMKFKFDPEIHLNHE